MSFRQQSPVVSPADKPPFTQRKLVGEGGFEPPTPWSRNNDGSAISLIRLAWLCVTDHGFMRFSALI
jgi:hypothetical protein